MLILIGGGNTDMTPLDPSSDHAPASSGRLMNVAVTNADSPRRPVGFLGVVAEHGTKVARSNLAW